MAPFAIPLAALATLAVLLGVEQFARWQVRRHRRRSEELGRQMAELTASERAAIDRAVTARLEEMGYRSRPVLRVIRGGKVDGD